MEALYERLLEPTRPEYDSPAGFLRDAVEYFRWAESHPFQEEVVGFYQGVACRTHKEVRKVFTEEGLFSFLNLPSSFFDTYGKRGQEWADAIARVRQIIRHDKFTGAVSGLYNANIISRDLGLAEKTELTGKDGGPVQAVTFDASKLGVEALAELMEVLDGIDESEADAQRE